MMFGHKNTRLKDISISSDYFKNSQVQVKLELYIHLIAPIAKIYNTDAPGHPNIK